MKKTLTGRRLGERLFPFFLISPGVIILVLFAIYPLICNLVMSLMSVKLTDTETPFVAFKNYIDIIGGQSIWSSMGRSLLWTVINVIFMLILGMATAIILNTETLLAKILKVVILIPWVLPQIVTGYTWSMMLSQDVGIITEIMKNLHLVGPDFSWFQSAGMAFSATIIANVWRGFPFFALMIYARMISIPQSQLDAARIDGANGVQCFMYVVLNHIKSVVIMCCALSFVWTFNAYDIVKIMTNGGPGEDTLMLPLIIQREAFSYYNLSRSATMSIIVLAVMVIFFTAYLIIQKKIIRKRGGKAV